MRDIRTSVGMTQEELAEAAGISRSIIARLELGANQPTWQTVIALARELGCLPNDFLPDGRLPQPTKPAAKPKAAGKGQRTRKGE